MSKSISGVDYIRVKRRRDEDSVQALLLEEERNSKKGKFVFKLAETIETETLNDDTPLLKLGGTEDEKKLVYVLEREKERDAELHPKEELPDSIAEMLTDYLNIHEKKAQPQKKRKSSRKHTKTSATLEPILDYVYDVYVKQDLPEDEDEFVYDGSTVGYIRIVDDDGDMIPEEEIDPDRTMLTDDEDSNEEDYYQNDYPEDEDDDRSIVIGSDEDPSEAEDIVYLDEANNDIDQSVNPEGATQQDEFDTLFQNYGNSSNLLSSLNANNYVDLDYDGDDLNDDAGEDHHVIHKSDINNSIANSASVEEPDTEPKRNIFFPSDHDDETAMHRDRIFGELQNMIDRA